MPNTRRRWIIFIAVNIAALLAIPMFMIYFNLTSTNGVAECALHRVLNLYCPSCGGTRALWSMLTLNIWASILYHPMVLLGAALFLYCDIRAFISIVRKEEYVIHLSRLLGFGYIGLIVGFFVLRNVLLLLGVDLVGDFIP